MGPVSGSGMSSKKMDPLVRQDSVGITQSSAYEPQGDGRGERYPRPFAGEGPRGSGDGARLSRGEFVDDDLYVAGDAGLVGGIVAGILSWHRPALRDLIGCLP